MELLSWWTRSTNLQGRSVMVPMESCAPPSTQTKTSKSRSRRWHEQSHRCQSSSMILLEQIGNVFDDWRDAKRIVREIKLLRFFQHENIIQLRDIIKPPLKTGYKDIYIVMELMDTDLHKVIKSKQVLSDDHIKYFVFQILLGLKYMHSANVIHRDLKPNNLLVNKECKVKICDLGLARGFELENELKTEYVTTRFYRAPEVLLSVSEYSKAIDVWSVGCIFGELLTRTIIFPGKDPLDQLHHILAILGTPSNEEMKFIKSEMALRYIKTLPKRDKQDWKNIIPKTNPLACDLLEKMLTFNPETRYCVDDCLNHPYLKDLTDKFEVRSCESTFDWSFDNQDNSIEALQTIIYNESLAFHPENQMTNDGC
eukprot:TRINITY_DN617_c0_g4_i4.p1 TRINITY_DN617_c0_g4~~TRINITY_DN617_c0_g4_i4.p1  ORF type:complete len:369 (-),score=30.89 TRINITY_DN617_c0_g4_i4:262-1368(-)